MSERIRVTAIGSCRIRTPFKSAAQTYPVIENSARIYGYTHSSAEALQQIKFLQGDYIPPEEVLPLLTPGIDIRSISSQRHSPSDIYFVELSSAKVLRIGEAFVQLNYVTKYFSKFFEDKARAKKFWHLSDGTKEAEKRSFLKEQESYLRLPISDQALLTSLTLETSTHETLVKDLSEIRDRLGKVVIVTHCNALTPKGTTISSRERYISQVENAAMEIDLPFFNPTISMQVFGQRDAMSDPETSLSHYSEDFGGFLFEGLYQRHIAPLKGKPPKTSSAALSEGIGLFKNRHIIPSISPHIGGVAFITGSLGAGGAERQMSRLAIEMKRQQNNFDAETIGITGPIEVFVSNLSSERERDFFLPDLKRADIPVSLINKLPYENFECIEENALEKLFKFLPNQTSEALRRLSPRLSMLRPEVVYIWQDGAVLSSALAALAAGVPRIVISLRGMPPNLRPEIMRPEYFEMYIALSKIPGVIFSTNSYASANAYAKWLGLSPDKFEVVHNAADTISRDGTEADANLWKDFEYFTEDANFTFGGVFRFDQNKRPMMWLEFAAAALVAHPRSRFILVGDGDHFTSAQNYAEELGIAHRCLFVGRTSSVGYWMSKMDALGLLSRFEGLPNVLIEAQLAGIPVISTPAGGACETFVPNETGYLLSSNQSPQLAQFLKYYIKFSGDPSRRIEMGKAATTFASETFSKERIVSKTLNLLANTPVRETTYKSLAFG